MFSKKSKRGRYEISVNDLGFHPSPINSATNTPRHSRPSSPTQSYLEEASNILIGSGDDSMDGSMESSPSRRKPKHRTIRSSRVFSEDSAFFGHVLSNGSPRHPATSFDGEDSQSGLVFRATPNKVGKHREERSLEQAYEPPRGVEVGNDGDQFGDENDNASAKSSFKIPKKRTKEETKASHRMIERRRTRRINDLIQKLKNEMMLNGFRVKKDKASILESAVDCIQKLRKDKQKMVSRLELAEMRERAFLTLRGFGPMKPGDHGKKMPTPSSHLAMTSGYPRERLTQGVSPIDK